MDLTGQTAGKEVIRGNRIWSEDGSTTMFTASPEVADTMTIIVDGEACSAQLVGEELRWNDGDVWIRTSQSTQTRTR